MIKNIWSVLCERVVVDKETNLASYLTSVEEISGPKLPATYPLLTVGCLWEKDIPESTMLEFRLMLKHPDGKEKLLFQSQKPMETERVRTNIVINNMLFPSEGRFVFLVQLKSKEKWQTCAELPIRINCNKDTIENK